LSVSDHVQRQAIIISAQTLHAFRILRANGIGDMALEMILDG